MLALKHDQAAEGKIEDTEEINTQNDADAESPQWCAENRGRQR
jgi:hypothetical protein